MNRDDIKRKEEKENKEMLLTILVFSIMTINLIVLLVVAKLETDLLKIIFWALSLLFIFNVSSGIIKEKIYMKAKPIFKEASPKLFWVTFYGDLIMTILLLSMLIKSI